MAVTQTTGWRANRALMESAVPGCGAFSRAGGSNPVTSTAFSLSFSLLAELRSRFAPGSPQLLSPTSTHGADPCSFGPRVPVVAPLPSPARLPLSQGATGFLWRLAQAMDLGCGPSDTQVFGAALASLRIHLDLVGDLLPLRQAGQAGALDGADMNENVVSAVIRRNESETLLTVEPLDRTGSHNLFPSLT